MDETRKNHSSSDIRISDRAVIEISGVDRVLSYDEESIVLSLCGTKTGIEGECLRVTVLSVEQGRICAEGKINAVICEEEIPVHRGFFSKMFGGKS